MKPRLYTVSAMLVLGDNQIEYPLGVEWLRANSLRDATMWASRHVKPSTTQISRRIQVAEAGWLDRVLIWLNLFPVIDITNGDAP